MSRWPRRFAFPPRQVVLFVLAITLPCLAVVALGLRVVQQEGELALQRKDDDRRLAVAGVRQEIGQALARVRAIETLRAAGDAGTIPPSDLVVLATPVRAGRVVMPWEANDLAASLRARMNQQPAARLFEAGERAEMRRPAEAVEAYRRAAASPDPFVAAHARLALARALARAGRTREADALNAALAAESFDITDEYGMPLAIYAAQRLTERRVPLPDVLRAEARDFLREGRWPARAACYALQELGAAARGSTDGAIRDWGSEIERLAAARLADAERVIATQNELPALLPRRGPAADQPRWLLTGDPAWLVGVAPVRDDEAVLIAVDARRLAASLPPLPGATDIVLSGAGGPGEPLGEPLPGVRLSYAPVETHAGALVRLQRWFYAAALALVLGVTGIGAFLLWRDVRREMRVASMRAQFVSSVSHELKTPLTSIRMFAETLRMGRGMEPATRDEYLDTIINESERLTRLLNNVLDFSRIEHNRKTYRLQPVNVADVIRTAARTIEYPLAQDRFELRLDLDDAVPPVQADADAMQQAVLNLLTNAMKYSGASRRIELSLTARDGRAIVAVTDHGVGIPAEDQPRLFERFYRARTPENQRIPGTGLGLTIVRHIVDAHAGTVSVDSTPGAGSTFSIALPLRQAPGPAVMAETAEAPS